MFAGIFAAIFALTWLGWTILGILTFSLFFLANTEKWGWSSTCFILSALAIYYFLPVIVPSFWALLWYGLLYIVCGIIYAFFVRWPAFVYKAKEKYDDAVKDAKVSRTKNFDISPDIKLYMPLVSDNKERLSGWMAFWPWSAIGWIVDDPIRRMYKSITHLFESMGDAMSRKIFHV